MDATAQIGVAVAAETAKPVSTPPPPPSPLYVDAFTLVSSATLSRRGNAAANRICRHRHRCLVLIFATTRYESPPFQAETPKSEPASEDRPSGYACCGGETSRHRRRHPLHLVRVPRRRRSVRRRRRRRRLRRLAQAGGAQEREGRKRRAPTDAEEERRPNDLN